MLDAILQRLLARHGGRQMFVFGSSGEPFWAAHVPVAPEDLSCLERALGVPADDLPWFNDHIVGPIAVIEAYAGPRFTGAIDRATNLPFDP